MLRGGGAIGALVIALAAQDTLGNFFSGIFLLLDQPFHEGDDIQIETGEVCRVVHIGLRSTKLPYKADHERFIMPNNMLANERIVNLLHPDRSTRSTSPSASPTAATSPRSTRPYRRSPPDTL